MEFVDDEENGWIEILEEPKQFEHDTDDRPYEGLYWGGTDSYDQDEAATSSSKGAMVIRKAFRKDSKSPFYVTPVGLIVERPTTAQGGAELFYMHTIYACIYFGCTNNIEYSNLRIFDFYKNKGFSALLEERPQLAFAGKILESKAQNQFGTDKVLKPHILAISKDVLTPEYIDNLYFLRIIQALIDFKYDPKYNCDITMAFAESEVNAKEHLFYVVTPKESSNSTILGMAVYREDRNGEIIQAYI